MASAHELGRHPSTHNIMFEVASSYPPNTGDGDSNGPNTTTTTNTSLITRLLRLIRRPSSRPRACLKELPNALLVRIFNELPLLDQVCLALTCKSFHFVLNPVFENEALRFPRLYQLKLLDAPSQQQFSLALLERAGGIGRNKLGRTRYRLLQRLEDRRLKYCVKCMKLHRREAFAQPTYHGPMVYREYCWTEAGVVDLCPCVTLTVRDKGRIVRCLERMKRGEGVLLTGGLEKAFVPLERVRGENGHGDVLPLNSTPKLVHECQISDHGLISAKIKTVLCIRNGISKGKGSPILVAETSYNVTTDRRVLDWRPSEGFRDAQYNLLWAMRMSERGLLLDDYDVFGRRLEGETRSDTLSVVRNLGGCDVPVDGHWARQDRLMSPSFLRLTHAYGN
ncbi:F-box protein [Aspergillus undulatus]|uniref:F-box protein n=1 Tax=Aspergillus undulatus TaxID=1810928 RepID=UPI003CCD2735